MFHARTDETLTYMSVISDLIGNPGRPFVPTPHVIVGRVPETATADEKPDTRAIQTSTYYAWQMSTHVLSFEGSVGLNCMRRPASPRNLFIDNRLDDVSRAVRRRLRRISK